MLITMSKQIYMFVQEAKGMHEQMLRQTHRPSMQNECECDMCHKFRIKKVSQFLEIKRNHQLKIINEVTTGLRKKTFLKWVLKRLTIPNNKIVLKGLNIYVSEICFYENGELSSLYMNKDIQDPTLKEIPKQRLTVTLLQKTLNERRWKYREYVQSKKGGGKVDTKQAIILQFKDGFERLLSESQFTSILQKRRLDPFWSTVHSFQNFIPTPRDKQEGVTIKYVHQQNLLNELFIRAKIVIKVSATQIVQCYKNYISEQQQQKFCNELIESKDQNTLFTYMTYKIICFVEEFYDTRITKGCFQWAIDQLKRPILIDVKRLQHQELIKYNWTPESLQKKEKANEQRIFYEKDIPPLNPQSQATSIKIQGEMKNTFQSLKQYYGLSLKQQEDVQQTKNQQYFKKVYPDLTVDLEKLKLFDIPQFKQKYLNEKPQRKPMVSQFKPPMIRVLHNLTPVNKSKHKRSFSMTKPNYNHIPLSPFKNPSTRLNSGRSTINTTWYNTFYNQTKSLNLFDF